MSSSIDRRTLLRRGLQASGLALSLPILEACGSSSAKTTVAATSSATSAAGATSAAATGAPATSGTAATSAAAAKDLGTLDYRLAWIKNVEFAGTYIADTKGYFKDAGFSKVNLIAGGPTATAAETDVVTKKAFVALSSPDRTAAAIKAGAKVKIVGTQYQKNPFAVMSMAAKPIMTPQDMIGKRIGVQAANEAVWEAFLKANNIPASKITKIPAGFDPTVLTKGGFDGWFSYITNEPNVLTLAGFKVTTFLLADHNYPLVGESYVVSEDSIAKDRDKIKALFLADIKGWKDSAKDPAAGAALAANTYGKGLGLTTAEQTLESKSQNLLINTDETAKNGIFTMTPDLVTANIKTLAIAGYTVTAEQLFDLSIIDEVYKENPTLI
jgi:ABC-type nitrate/sulfonate/bicarbonate transport system substrate-binding protein